MPKKEWLPNSEKAYLRAAGGGLDAAHPDIVNDLANREMPKTAHGFLAEALARRRAAGTPPFTVLCCDNLPANGATLHRLLSEFAEMRDARLGAKGDAKLAKHIADAVAFPSSMVDRIVPATVLAPRPATTGDGMGLNGAPAAAQKEPPCLRDATSCWAPLD